MEKPTAEVTDIDLKKVSMQSITLESVVDITNPYSHDLPIGEISYRLMSANSGTIVDHGSVKANDKTSMIIPVTVVPCDFLLSIMKGVGRDWDIEYTWEIGLTMHIPVVGRFTLLLSRRAL
nr:late embryogenesis abundant protein LEA56 [Pinus tabuliformis]